MMKAPIVEQLGIPMTGLGTRKRLAAQIILGLEMGHLRRILGYEGMGSWQAHRAEAKAGERILWEDYCKREAGISEPMVRIYLECADAVRTRITIMAEKCGKDWKKILSLMDQQPSLLTQRQRMTLLERMATVGIGHRDTQASLRKEYRAHRTDEPLEVSSPMELLANTREARKGRELMKWAKTNEPEAVQFRRRAAEIRLRIKRNEETRSSIGGLIGISNKTLDLIARIKTVRQLLEEAKSEGGGPYSAEKLLDLAQRKGITP